MKKHARSLVRVLSYQFGTENIRFGAEIGVWRGELSADLLRSFPDLYLVMVDLWKPYDESAMYDKDNNAQAMAKAMRDAIQNTIFAKNRRMIASRGSVDEASRWVDSCLDFVFIDADHYYESVKADLHAWWPKLGVDGVASGHDYNSVGDRRKGWGVKRAVDEFFEPLGLEVRVEPGNVWWTMRKRTR